MRHRLSSNRLYLKVESLIIHYNIFTITHIFDYISIKNKLDFYL